MPIKDRFQAAAIGQTRIEQIVKGLIRDRLYLVYYIVFGKEAVKLTKKLPLSWHWKKVQDSKNPVFVLFSKNKNSR